MIFCLALITHAAAQPEPFYVSAKQGIYYGGIDAATGKLAPLKLVQPAYEPAYLAQSPTQRVLYACFDHTVGTYREAADGSLTSLGEKPSGGKGTTHLAVDATGQRLFTANYDDSGVSCLSLASDGSIGSLLSVTSLVGKGPNAERQECSHPHSVNIDAANRHDYVCDLGADKIWILPFDPGTELAPSVQVELGSGPRHLAFDAAQRFVYVNGELGANVTVFARNGKTGALKTVQTISTLAPDRPKTDGGTAEIVLHPNGKWLYVSDRIGNTIAVFAVEPDGRLKLLEDAPSIADEVRGFWIDPAGRWLVAAGLKDNRLVVLKIDPAAGKLSLTDQTAAVPAPNAILFVPAK